MTNRAILFLLVVLAAASFLLPLEAATLSRVQRKSAPERGALIGPINDDPFGCGCGFSFPSEKRKQLPPLVLSSDIDEETALMNIDGVDMELRLARATEVKGKERTGSRQTRTYIGSGVRVFAVYVTTGMCKPNDEDCEAYNYNATVTVTKGERKQIAKLKGTCGC